MVAGAQDLTGVLLDERYRVGELLAVGGMSRVYRGVDTRLDRAVAVKVMDSRLAADPAFRGRLAREARAMARIEHPCVVDVHDHGEQLSADGVTDPLVYLVMELVTGANLRDLLVERGSLTVPEALAILEPVLSALSAAHRHGLAHRDVKPENVLISHTGAIKVADFGLVTAAAAGTATRSGVIMGTPAYLSPEQVIGEGIGPRTDVYAAGVLLFEMLTGQPPFTGEHALSLAYQHVNTDVPVPSTRVPGLAPELDGLVEQATRRAAEDRPSDAKTLLFAVRGVRAALGIPPVPVPVPTKAGGRPAPERTTAHQPSPEPATAGLPSPEAVRAPRATRVLTFADWPPHAGPATDPEPADPRELDRLADPPRSGGRRTKIGVGVVLLFGLLAAIGGWIAGGGSRVVTPPVVGMEDQAAQRALTKVGLLPVVTERHNDRVPAGLVAESNPVPGTEVRTGNQVTLVVSTGHPRVPPIPVGAPVPAAEGLLREADLTVDPERSVRRYHPTATVGTVIGTVQATGTELTIGAPVTLVLSKGPDDELSPDEVRDSIGNLLNHVLGGGN